ncbi:MAG: 23S rRNA (pseudouridine(1915)-N(3))-methyltransferase RlmH [Ruminococcus sp.]|nr:23S rRNA (pseudouridine(1915)-N(3))-methyltransferase RlmH [Ruminococcus sp.]
MMIKIICLGKLKENYLNLLVDDYLKRISKYHKIELIELKDEDNLASEAKKILKYIGREDYVITLEIEGKSFNSLEFAEFVNKTFITNSTITFIIGSSLGLHDSIKEKSNLSLSFSKFTLPHGLFRGVLLEQIYRAFKINNHESYHK